MSAEAATHALGGKWSGRRGVAFCPVHENTRTPALSLADGEDGKLLVKCFAGCDAVDVLRELNRRGLGVADIRVRPKQKPECRILDRRNFAMKLWCEAYPVQDTLADQYLRERGIRPPFPASLRFHPLLQHTLSQMRHPAMIGLVTIGKCNEAIGIHRTFLAPDARKAHVMPCKMMLGNCGGGAVRLSDAGDGPIVICEGIETGLSLRDALAFEEPAPRVWAALSTSGISGIRVPFPQAAIVVAPDGDLPGHRSAEALAARAKAEGCDVRIMAAPAGQDWNDVARGMALKVSQ